MSPKSILRSEKKKHKMVLALLEPLKQPISFDLCPKKLSDDIMEGSTLSTNDIESSSLERKITMGIAIDSLLNQKKLEEKNSKAQKPKETEVLNSPKKSTSSFKFQLCNFANNSRKSSLDFQEIGQEVINAIFKAKEIASKPNKEQLRPENNKTELSPGPEAKEKEQIKKPQIQKQEKEKSNGQSNQVAKSMNSELSGQQQSQKQIQQKYKTEMCKNYLLTNGCKFGSQCSFAHGMQELRSKNYNLSQYKQRVCKQFMNNGICSYGQRCQYFHEHTNRSFQDKLELHCSKLEQLLLQQNQSTLVACLSVDLQENLFSPLKIFQNFKKDAKFDF